MSFKYFIYWESFKMEYITILINGIIFTAAKKYKCLLSINSYSNNCTNFISNTFLLNNFLKSKRKRKQLTKVFLDTDLISKKMLILGSGLCWFIFYYTQHRVSL